MKKERNEAKEQIELYSLRLDRHSDADTPMLLLRSEYGSHEGATKGLARWSNSFQRALSYL